MRLFACSLLDPDHRAAYDRLVSELLAGHGPRARPIPADSAHITYAFIARLDEAAVPRAAEAIRAATSRLEPFDVTLGVPTVSGAGRDARLIHAAIEEGRDRLVALADLVAGALTHALPDVAISRTISPHVTLARFQRGTTRRMADAIAGQLARAPTATVRRQRISTVHLVSSRLTSARPIYTVQAVVPVGPAGR